MAHIAMEWVPGELKVDVTPGARHLRKIWQKWKATGIMPNQMRMIIPDGKRSSPDILKGTGTKSK